MSATTTESADTRGARAPARAPVRGTSRWRRRAPLRGWLCWAPAAAQGDSCDDGAREADAEVPTAHAAPAPQHVADTGAAAAAAYAGTAAAAQHAPTAACAPPLPPEHAGGEAERAHRLSEPTRGLSTAEHKTLLRLAGKAKASALQRANAAEGALCRFRR
jgi:hypothetical protein